MILLNNKRLLGEGYMGRRGKDTMQKHGIFSFKLSKGKTGLEEHTAS